MDANKIIYALMLAFFVTLFSAFLTPILILDNPEITIPGLTFRGFPVAWLSYVSAGVINPWLSWLDPFLVGVSVNVNFLGFALDFAFWFLILLIVFSVIGKAKEEV